MVSLFLNVNDGDALSISMSTLFQCEFPIWMPNMVMMMIIYGLGLVVYGLGLVFMLFNFNAHFYFSHGVFGTLRLNWNVNATNRV